MKIAQYIDSYYPTVDGVVTTVKNYAEWLNEYGHKTHVVTLNTGYYENKDPFTVYKFKSMPLFVRKDYRIALTKFDRKTNKNINQTPVDLVHTHSPFFVGNVGLKYAKKHNLPIISTFHTKFYDDFLEETKSVIISKILLKKVVKYYEKVDYVWAVNEQTAKTLRDYGFKGNIEVMPNGFDDSFVKIPKTELHSIREEYHLDNKTHIFLFVGRLTKTKNIELTLKSLALYKKTNSNFVFFITGQGDDEKNFKNLTKKLGLNDNVIFTGKILDRRKLISMYTDSDLFLFPSVYDNAPLVVREAAACKLPTVTIKNCGAAENIIDNENGFLCEETPEELCQTIIRAMKNKKKLSKIGEKAQKTIAKPWSAIVKDVVKRYEQIIIEHQNKTK